MIELDNWEPEEPSLLFLGGYADGQQHKVGKQDTYRVRESYPMTSIVHAMRVPKDAVETLHIYERLRLRSPQTTWYVMVPHGTALDLLGICLGPEGTVEELYAMIRMVIKSI